MARNLIDNSLVGVIWDFDGTLVDTEKKNLSVLRKIIPHITKRPLSTFEILLCYKEYSKAVLNSSGWRDLYRKYLALTDLEIDRAAKLWGKNYDNDTTEVVMHSDIPQTLDALRWLPQGIVSSNDWNVIRHLLNEFAISNYFSFILGGQDRVESLQKPNPHLLLCGVHKIANKAGKIIYIGDHSVDFIMVKYANDYLDSIGSNLSILGIAFSRLNEEDFMISSPVRPHYFARIPLDVLNIVQYIN